MKFLSLEQFTQMWEMQDSLNTLTSGPDWTKKGQNWNLAIKDEVMEFFNYIGWKWWKEPDKTKSPKDLQARLELVDIWHFLLSSIIENEKQTWAADSSSSRIHGELHSRIASYSPKAPDVTVVSDLDSSYYSNYQKVAILAEVIEACDWTWTELYCYYIGKNVLNKFRQDNGYKTGEYQKIWEAGPDGSFEDNYFLENFIEVLILTEKFDAETLYSMLDVKYNQVLLDQIKV